MVIDLTKGIANRLVINRIMNIRIVVISRIMTIHTVVVSRTSIRSIEKIRKREGKCWGNSNSCWKVWKKGCMKHRNKYDIMMSIVNMIL